MEGLTREVWETLYEVVRLCFPEEIFADRRKDWKKGREELRKERSE